MRGSVPMGGGTFPLHGCASPGAQLTVPALTGVTVTVQFGCVGAKKLVWFGTENSTRVVVGGATGGVIHAESLSIVIVPWSRIMS